MPTVYVRPVNVKDSLSDAEVVAYWKWYAWDGRRERCHAVYREGETFESKTL